jgi:hypothetical protein
MQVNNHQQVMSYKMVSWVLMLRPIVIIVEPLPLGDVPVGHQEHAALTVDGVPHALEVLLLPALPATMKLVSGTAAIKVVSDGCDSAVSV